MKQFTRITLFLSVFLLASQPVVHAFDTKNLIQPATQAVETVKDFIAHHDTAFIIAGVLTLIIGSTLYQIVLKPKKKKKIVLAASSAKAKELFKDLCLKASILHNDEYFSKYNDAVMNLLIQLRDNRTVDTYNALMHYCNNYYKEVNNNEKND